MSERRNSSTSEALSTAETHASVGDSESALRTLDDALEDNPHQPELLRSKANELIRLGDLQGALKAQTELVSVTPSVSSLCDRANLYANLGDWKSAVRDIDGAIRLERSPHADLLRFKGTYLRLAGETEDAVAVLRTACSLSDTAPNWIALGDALLDVGQITEAIAVFRKASAAQSFAPADWNVRGDRLLRAMRGDEAISVYRAGIELSETADGWRGIAQALLGRGDYLATLEAAERACRMDETDARQWNLRGSALYFLFRLDESVECLRRSIELDPSMAAAWYNLALALELLERFPEALTSAERFAEMAPDDPDAWAAVATYHYTLEGFRQSVDASDRALSLRSSDTTALNIRGLALMEMGELEAAIACFDEALETDEALPYISFNKVKALSLSGQRDAAQRLVEQVTSGCAPDDGLVRRCWSIYLSEELREQEQAISVLEVARQASPNDWAVLCDLAELFVKVGRFADARRTAVSVLEGQLRPSVECAMRTVVWASSAFLKEPSREDDFRALLKVLRERLLPTGCKTQWRYAGLRRALVGRGEESEVEFALFTLLDLQERRLMIGDLSYFGTA
jgi:tetratricopeptide (TPR) repeat protein